MAKWHLSIMISLTRFFYQWPAGIGTTAAENNLSESFEGVKWFCKDFPGFLSTPRKSATQKYTLI